MHAHPDDESSKGAATMAKYVDEGVEVLVVSCTGGERGDILNPALKDRPDVAENIHAVRLAEMAQAARILGVQHHWLGFVDSGLPEGDPLPPLPDGCFALVPLEEASRALVEVVRRFRPHVMTTYDENGGYPHPDHIMCHKVSVAAFDAAGDPEKFPDAGEPWQPLKLYYDVTFTRERVEALHNAMLELGIESPYAEWISRWDERAADRRATERHHQGLLRRPVPAPGRRTAGACHPGRSGGLVLQGAAGRAAPGVPVGAVRTGPVDGGQRTARGRPVRRRPGEGQPVSVGRPVAVLADSDTGKGSPIGFFVVLVLVIAVYFLYRSMNRHLKRVPDSFEPSPPAGEPADPRQLLSEQPPARPIPSCPSRPARARPAGSESPARGRDAGSVSPREPGPDRP